MADAESIGVGIAEAEAEESDAMKELVTVVESKEGGGTRRMDGRSRRGWLDGDVFNDCNGEDTGVGVPRRVDCWESS
jgi:hypothetical protein